MKNWIDDANALWQTKADSWKTIADSWKKDYFPDIAEVSFSDKPIITHKIQVIAQKNSIYPQFNVKLAIRLANQSLKEMGLFEDHVFFAEGYTNPSGNIFIGDNPQFFTKYIDFIKSKSNTVIAFSNVASTRFRTNLDVFLSDLNGEYIETATVSQRTDNDKNAHRNYHMGLIRLDLVQRFGEDTILHNKPDSPTDTRSVYNLAYILLHILAHNSGLAHTDGYDTGILLGANDIERYLIDRPKEEIGTSLSIKDVMFGKYVNASVEDIKKYGFSNLTATRICNQVNVQSIKQTFR